MLGDDILDSYFGPHYLVVDLNTNEVIDFISDFNYFYKIEGRKATLNNLIPIN